MERGRIKDDRKFCTKQFLTTEQIFFVNEVGAYQELNVCIFSITLHFGHTLDRLHACKIIPRCTILQVSQRTKRLNDFTDLCIQATVKTLFKLIDF